MNKSNALCGIIFGLGLPDVVQRSPEPHGTVSGGQFGGNPSPTFEAQQNLAPTQASLNDMDDAVENSTVVHTPDTPCLGNNY